MAVLAQFTPGGPAGQLANESQSWMDRAHARDIQDQQMQLEKDQAARQKAQFDIMRPVMEAKSAADVASAQDQLSAAVGTQALRQQFLPLVQQGRDAWKNVMLEKDPAIRAQNAIDWAAQYAPVASLSEHQKEFDGYLHMAVEQTQNQQKVQLLQDRLDASKAMNENKYQAARDIAEGKNASATAIEDQKFSHQKELKTMATASAEAIARDRLAIKDPGALVQKAAGLDSEAEAIGATDPAQASVLKQAADLYRKQAEKIAAPKADPFAAIIGAWAGGAAPGSPATTAAPAAGSAPAVVPQSTLTPQKVNDLTKGIKF